MLWFVSQNGKSEGPLPEQRIAQLIRWGKISARAYICDERLSTWVSIRSTAFGPLLAHASALSSAAEAFGSRTLGALRGGTSPLSTRGAQRLGTLLVGVSMFAGALQLASGVARNNQRVKAATSAAAPAPALGNSQAARSAAPVR